MVNDPSIYISELWEESFLAFEWVLEFLRHRLRLSFFEFDWFLHQKVKLYHNTIPRMRLFMVLFYPLTYKMRSVFKLMLTRWCSQPIKYRIRESQPITERLESIQFKISYEWYPKYKNHAFESKMKEIVLSMNSFRIRPECQFPWWFQRIENISRSYHHFGFSVETWPVTESMTCEQVIISLILKIFE